MPLLKNLILIKCGFSQFIFKIFTCLLLVISISSQSFSQAQAPNPGASGGDDKSKTSSAGPRKQLATIIFAGLGGAVLGLSTLSFYGRPQDHLSNIAIGFAIGVITGTTIVTAKAATNPAEFYGTQYQPLIDLEKIRIAQADSSAVRFQYQFTF